jgi:hypothetical protein
MRKFVSIRSHLIIRKLEMASRHAKDGVLGDRACEEAGVTQGRGFYGGPVRAWSTLINATDGIYEMSSREVNEIRGVSSGELYEANPIVTFLPLTKPCR